ncbi:glycoside hydrolase family 99-like domain-containing protein [Candidatus Bipolaricaulota bacterium]|nr:glycoside hydrolase family 99-like domain-containing protein [Candidatus Bipolaricaulota bacterium]
MNEAHYPVTEGVKYLKNHLSRRNKLFKWVRNTLVGFIVIVAIFACLFADLPAFADEEKVTVPINQVVKTNKLSAEQLTKAEVTVPRSWVSEDYLEEHFPQEKTQTEVTDTKSPGEDINNIPDGVLTESPKIVSEQNESITVSDFNFEFDYDQGNLKESTVNFTVENENGNIEEVNLLLNGEKQLTPEDGAYDEATEEFSYDLKGLEEGNLYEGSLKIKGENKTDSIKFQIYPREFLNIADDDEINITAAYYIWYSKPGTFQGVHWEDNYRSAYEPKLGKYSSRNDEVIAKHIDWATGHGIDTFMISWWGNEDMNGRLQNFLENPLSDEINYSILWDCNAAQLRGTDGLFYFSEERVRGKFMNDMEYIADNLFGDKNYLRLKGKPVIYLNAEHDYRGPFVEALKEVEELVETPEDIFWIGQNAEPFTSQEKQREAVDSITQFNPIFKWSPWVKGADQDWILTKENLEEMYLSFPFENYFDAKNRGKHYIPTIIPGFNRISTDWQVIERTKEGFRYEIREARKMIDKDLKTIFINSFNEWIEATVVESSKEWGFEYLEIIKEELAGYKPKEVLRDELNHIKFDFNKTVSPEGGDPRKMTIRTSKIKFSDSPNFWNPKFVLNIGSEEDIRHIGRGWYPREGNKEENWRWASDMGVSSIYIPASKDLAYMELKAIPISGDIEADVYLNGELVDHIDFEEGWKTYEIKLS